MNEMIMQRQDPIRILVKKIQETDSTLIMNEATKAISYLAVTEEVLARLHEEKALLSIVESKFLDADP